MTGWSGCLANQFGVLQSQKLFRVRRNRIRFGFTR
jgi:hypothetical protein